MTIIGTEYLAERIEKVVTWVEDPEDLDHDYNDIGREDADWDDIARPPSVQALMDAGLVLEYLEKTIPNLVRLARKDGETWEQIGETLGISKQAAQQRFGR